MNYFKETFSDFGIPFVEKDANLILPSMESPDVIISKVVTPGAKVDIVSYRVFVVGKHITIGDLTPDEAVAVALFLFFIPRMRTMNDELDDTLQFGYNVLLTYFDSEISLLKENRSQLMDFISNTLLPFTEEVKK